MYYAILKAANSIAYFALIFLTWRFIDGEMPWKLGVGCVVLSASWLVLTRLHLGHYLQTYFDILSRLEIIVPMTIGLGLSLVALFIAPHLTIKVIALFEIVIWFTVYILYRLNRKRYMIQGHGPLPQGTWVSPPASVLESGDLILTSGQVAANLRESVGHGEMALKMPNGKMSSFSSYMTKGLVLNDLAAVASASNRDGHYIALRLSTPMTKEQIEHSAQIVEQMIAANHAWRDRVNGRIKKVLDFLHLPDSLKEAIYRLLKQTGYDYVGLFMGRLTKDHWTCIGACLELYKRLGIKTKPYGTGLLGFGTGIFDPIMPVRFLDDPAFRLLTEKDKKSLETSK